MTIKHKVLDAEGEIGLRGLIEALLSDDDGCVVEATFTTRRGGTGCYPVVVLAIDPLHPPLVVLEAIAKALGHAEAAWSPVVQEFLRTHPPAENGIPVQ